MNDKIKSFKDLDVWKEGHKLVILIYAITKLFPREEMFGLISQMRRAVVSVTSNIAEGFSRGSYKEKLQFYFHALGSITELQNQLEIAKDLGYLPQNRYNQADDQLARVQMILCGLIKRTRTIINTK